MKKRRKHKIKIPSIFSTQFNNKFGEDRPPHWVRRQMKTNKRLGIKVVYNWFGKI